MLTQPCHSLYVHFPWCISKCPYCDFNSHALKKKLPEADYIDHLLNDLAYDLKFLEKRKPLKTIFIGGGTPSLISPKAIEKLLKGIALQLPFAENLEITLEANPNSGDQQKFLGYRQAGINRLSIGVQSFSTPHLKKIGRAHDSDQAWQAVHAAKEAGFTNINLDIMYGLPDQSLSQALKDVEIATSLNPSHISWYELTIEPNTLFAYKTPKGLPSQEKQFEIEKQGIPMLAKKGYKRYEISAFCQNDLICQHNYNYWTFGDYLGIGAGAHGKITQQQPTFHMTRYFKYKSPLLYSQPSLKKLDNPYQQKQYQILKQDYALEFFMNRLRLLAPLPLTSIPLWIKQATPKLPYMLEKAKKEGFIEKDLHNLKLTPWGRNHLNTLLGYFV